MPAIEAVRLAGPRVVVRTTAPGDAATIAAYYDRNRDHLSRWGPDHEPAIYTEAFWVERIRTHDDERARGVGHRLTIDMGGAPSGCSRSTPSCCARRCGARASGTRSTRTTRARAS